MKCLSVRQSIRYAFKYHNLRLPLVRMTYVASQRIGVTARVERALPLMQELVVPIVGAHHKVAAHVVRFVLVNVVDYCDWREVMAECGFCDENVLEYVAVTRSRMAECPNAHVSVLVAPATLPPWMVSAKSASGVVAVTKPLCHSAYYGSGSTATALTQSNRNIRHVHHSEKGSTI